MTRLPQRAHGRAAYAGASAALASMHGKATAIAPVLRHHLGLTVETARGIDTDTLGTFTGEIPRLGSMREALLAKASLGMRATGLSIGIASEGAYGPHPQIPFLPAGIELIAFVDEQRGITIIEELLEDAPVYLSQTVACPAQTEDWLTRIRFPSHAVIVQPNVPNDPITALHKGLRNREAIDHAIAEAASASADGRARLSTDMRAHMNPTRMQSLNRLAKKLALRMATECPSCASPGFGQIGAERGLPCRACGTETALIRRRLIGCAACDFLDYEARDDGLSSADPSRCQECNP